MIVFFILSFGSTLTFPRPAFPSLVQRLWSGGGIVDIHAAFGARSSSARGMILTVLLALSRALRSERGFMIRLFASSRSRSPHRALDRDFNGIGLVPAARRFSGIIGRTWLAEDQEKTTMGLFTSGLARISTWTLPFGLLIMFAIFNRFDNRYEEAARESAPRLGNAALRPSYPSCSLRDRGQVIFASWDGMRDRAGNGQRNPLPMNCRPWPDRDDPKFTPLAQRTRRVLRRHRGALAITLIRTARPATFSRRHGQHDPKGRIPH
jgi:putative spermidine/putrescine transport system permease protein